MFLAVIMEFQSGNNKKFVVHEMPLLGDGMQRMLKVDHSLHTLFADLVQTGYLII
jgi:hypothetical protein